MLQFSYSVVEQFIKSEHNKHLRLGQEFHQYMELEKITGSDKYFCDKLYYVPSDTEARRMIYERTDYTQ